MSLALQSQTESQPGHWDFPFVFRHLTPTGHSPLLFLPSLCNGGLSSYFWKKKNKNLCPFYCASRQEAAQGLDKFPAHPAEASAWRPGLGSHPHSLPPPTRQCVSEFSKGRTEGTQAHILPSLSWGCLLEVSSS